MENKDKRENKKILKSWFAHSIRGCRPLWWARGVLIPSPCVNDSWTLIFKICRPSTFSILVFPTFSSNKHWWRLHAFSFLERCTLGLSERLFHTPAERQVATIGDSTGTVREFGHSVSVQCFYHDFFFIYFPFFSFVLYITFAMLLCLVCVCLSITFIARNTFSTHTWHLHLAHTLRY